jgi:dTDP-4-amino-4,6-dideoxygalactose transaminase
VTKDPHASAIPAVGLQREWVEIGDELRTAMERVVSRGQFILGPEVDLFEEAFAAYCGAGAGVGMASGTDALTLALAAAGIGPGDEVITTTLTSGATATAIVRAGASPVLVDVEPDTLNIDPALVEAAMGPRTRAIVPVHLYGRPAAIGALLEIARRNQLHVVEDCAQAIGATAESGRVGSLGALGCFSFYPTKNLGAYGDGGIVVTSDAELTFRLRLLRTYGWEKRDYSVTIGYNSRLDELQAAFLAVKLKYVDRWNERRSAIAARYTAALSRVDGVTTPGACTGHVWHLYVVKVANRDEIRARLADRGVPAGVHYAVPLHRQPAFAEFGEGRKFPHAEKACQEILSLPIYPQLRDDEVDRVAETMSAALLDQRRTRRPSVAVILPGT